MSYKLLRIETCSLCGYETKVYEYSPATYGEQGHSRVKKGNSKMLVCTHCWNRNVNTHIFFDVNGWEWFNVARVPV